MEEYPDFIKSTGYGTGEGLCGWNCRHSFQPWSPELKNPYVDENGKPKIDIHESQKQYDISQKQRYYERAMRKTQRQLVAKNAEIQACKDQKTLEILNDDFIRLSTKLKKQHENYLVFCKDNKLTFSNDRIRTAGFDYKLANKVLNS